MKRIILLMLGVMLGLIVVVVVARGRGMLGGKASGQHLNAQSLPRPDVLDTATFAGGCFWCVESALQETRGVYEAVSGFMGGDEANPSYKQVSAGGTGHVESVQVMFDPQQLSYDQLLDVFWHQIDPTDAEGQFVDRGFQYTTAIFYYSEEQRLAAEASKQRYEDMGVYDGPIVTRIVPAGEFYPAEDYHQDYYLNNTLKYTYYRAASGRDQYLESVWGTAHYELPGGYEKPDEATLRSVLTPLQYDVTQEEGTEPAFNNEYWDNEEDGIYVDILSGEPLFSSREKYESGTGWPSFWQPLEPANVVEKMDYKLIYPRTEIRSRAGDNHIGHVFNDGPEPTGLRYCMNSAALRFVPKDELTAQGYGEYLGLFEN